MYLITKPGIQHIRQFLDVQSQHAFTYEAIGATRHAQPPAGYVVDHHRFRLGSGQHTFAAAQQALRLWEHYRFDWIELHRPEADLSSQPTVGVLARALGLWVLNACRVVYVVQEDAPLRRFAFAYGTLLEHVESGEERFQVEWRAEDDSVWYDILAFSRPRQWFARLAYPYVRRLQRRFARDSGRAMQAAVG